jgi:hypothetical protein
LRRRSGDLACSENPEQDEDEQHDQKHNDHTDDVHGVTSRISPRSGSLYPVI